MHSGRDDTLKVWKSDGLLLITASIWGFGFVAQRAGMEHVGPFFFNAVRFSLGALSLIPWILIRRQAWSWRASGVVMVGPRSSPPIGPGSSPSGEPPGVRPVRLGVVPAVLLLGAVLFLGATMQQVGLVYTTAGKAGFITGLYVIFVPLLGLFWRQRPGTGAWIGAVLSVAGLYLLSVREGFTLAPGDAYVVVSAFLWAVHVLLIGWMVSWLEPLVMAALQFAVCALLSWIAAVCFEDLSLAALMRVAVPVLYGGLISVGIAYTLQVVAQRHAKPAHAAILMSLESVFAALGGWLILRESLHGRELAGCGLMLSGALLAQLWVLRRVPGSAVSG